MTLDNPRQLQATREKLDLLERKIAEIRRSPGGNKHAEELTVRSLRRLSNQLKEEIARCEAASLHSDDSTTAS